MSLAAVLTPLALSQAVMTGPGRQLHALYGSVSRRPRRRLALFAAAWSIKADRDPAGGR